MEKLDLSKFEPKLRKFAKEFAEIICSFKMSNFKKHISLAEDAPQGYMDYEHFSAPCTYSLILYKTKGLRALYEFSIQRDNSASYDAPRALIAIALNEINPILMQLDLLQRYIPEQSFKKTTDKIKNIVSDDKIREEAKQLISKMVSHFSVIPENRYMIGRLLDTAPLLFSNDFPKVINYLFELVAKNSLNISEEIIKDFEILLDKKLKEKSYQNYLKKYPALLDPLSSEVIELKSFGEKWKSDFVIKRLDNEYVFVELEKPQDLLFTKYPHPAAPLSHALGQVLNWFVWVEDNISYAQKNGFPDIHSPYGIIIMGRKDNLNSEQQRFLATFNDMINPRIKVMTYDDLLYNAKNVINNLTKK